ncbi:MAG TPA: GGDEF domain-containing protein [Rhodoplanes sp.]|nr:GGDEF domain-containing protein [Rhodoplanes sp.]
MSLQGPVVVIANEVDGVLLRALESAGASPVVGAAWAKAAGMVERIAPSAVVIAESAQPADQRIVDKTAQTIAGFPLYTPVLACAETPLIEAMPDALPIATDASCERIVARLASALRVRALHASVTRRASLLPEKDAAPPDLPDGDPLEDATVLVAGRGRSYPGLSAAVGERIGLIGALSVETAARYLNTRDVDGIVIGEGFGPPTLAAFLTALSEDARFRDLPVALLPEPPPALDSRLLPNLERLTGDPGEVVARLIPLVRLHAFSARLQRQLAALKAQGLIDARTGLFTIPAFLADLARAIEEAQGHDAGLSLARFSFPPSLDRRVSLDAARLVSRLVRGIDFGCRAHDGSILVAFSATALRTAHVITRRIASVLRHTMLAPADDPTAQVDASVTLATLKATDTVESLLARVCEPEPVAVA